MNQQGFTLLEILVAVTITGIIVTVIFSFFDQSFSTWQAVDLHSSWQQQWRILESELKEDLHSVFSSPVSQQDLFRGSRRKVKWRRMKQGKLQEVVYYFNQQENELIKQVKAVKKDKVIKELKFFSQLNLKTVSFSFNHQQVGYWKRSWNYQQQEYLPAVIRVKLTAKEVQLPPLVVENFIGRKYGGR